MTGTFAPPLTWPLTAITVAVTPPPSWIT